jgi:hypothetical protein
MDKHDGFVAEWPLTLHGRPTRRWACTFTMFVCYLAEVFLMVLLGGLVASYSADAALGVFAGAVAVGLGWFSLRAVFQTGADL